MAQFPIESSDIEGIVDAVNSLLSGPGGLGQNFSGVTSYSTAYITGNFRIPYLQDDVAQLYVAQISIDQCEMLDARTVKITFASTQASVPFSLGNGLSVENVDVDWYNNNGAGSNGGKYVPIGVVACTTDYVIIRSTSVDPLQPIGYGGDVFYISTGNPDYGTIYVSSNDVRVNVTGGTDRVFISAQINNIMSYLINTEVPVTFTYTVDIDRYRGFINNDPVNPDYTFEYDATVAEKVYNFVVDPAEGSTGTLPMTETIFTTLLDPVIPPSNEPPYPVTGLYRYFISLGLYSDATLVTDFQITTSQIGLRTLTAQVVKQ